MSVNLSDFDFFMKIDYVRLVISTNAGLLPKLLDAY